MSFIAPLIGPIAGAIGGLFGHGGSNNNQQSQQSSGGGGLGSAIGNTVGQLGGAIGSSLLGGQLGKIGTGPTDAEQQVLRNNAAVQGQGLATGQNLIGMGTGAIQQPLNYWSSILSGNKGLMTSALAPEIGQIGQGYESAARTSAALNPRGGPSAAFLSQLPWAQQRDISTLLQQARPQAAGALAGAGNQLLGQGTNALYASTSAGQSILQQQEEMLRRQQQTSQNIGRGLFSMGQQGQNPIQNIIGSIFNRGGGRGGGGGGFNPNSINLGDPGTATTPPFQGLLGNGLGLTG